MTAAGSATAATTATATAGPTTTTTATTTTAAATVRPTIGAHGRETLSERNLEFGRRLGVVIEVRNRDARQRFADRAFDGLQI